MLDVKLLNLLTCVFCELGDVFFFSFFFFFFFAANVCECLVVQGLPIFCSQKYITGREHILIAVVL